MMGKLAVSDLLVIHLVLPPGEGTDAEITGMALATSSGEACYLPLGYGGLDSKQTLERLQPLLAEARVAKVAHDGKEIINRLVDHGMELVNLEFDTMIAAYLSGEKSLGLKALALGKLGVEITPAAEMIAPKRGLMVEDNLPQIARSACAEAAVIGRLRPLLRGELEERGC
jgi:DNA polymerase-1